MFLSLFQTMFSMFLFMFFATLVLPSILIGESPFSAISILMLQCLCSAHEQEA